MSVSWSSPASGQLLWAGGSCCRSVKPGAGSVCSCWMIDGNRSPCHRWGVTLGTAASGHPTAPSRPSFPHLWAVPGVVKVWFLNLMPLESCLSEINELYNVGLWWVSAGSTRAGPSSSSRVSRQFPRVIKRFYCRPCAQHSHQWYKCVPTSLLYSFIHVFPKQFQVVLLSLRLNQYNCLSAPSIFISAEGRLFNITFYPLFHTFEEDLSLLLYFIKLPLLHSISTSFPLSLRAWWVLFAKCGDLWIVKCILRYRSIFVFA